MMTEPSLSSDPACKDDSSLLNLTEMHKEGATMETDRVLVSARNINHYLPSFHDTVAHDLSSSVCFSQVKGFSAPVSSNRTMTHMLSLFKKAIIGHRLITCGPNTHGLH